MTPPSLLDADFVRELSLLRRRKRLRMREEGVWKGEKSLRILSVREHRLLGLHCERRKRKPGKMPQLKAEPRNAFGRPSLLKAKLVQ